VLVREQITRKERETSNVNVSPGVHTDPKTERTCDTSATSLNCPSYLCDIYRWFPVEQSHDAAMHERKKERNGGDQRGKQELEQPVAFAGCSSTDRTLNLPTPAVQQITIFFVFTFPAGVRGGDRQSDQITSPICTWTRTTPPSPTCLLALAFAVTTNNGPRKSSDGLCTGTVLYEKRCNSAATIKKGLKATQCVAVQWRACMHGPRS
jgi:hypothetical protein